MFTLLAIAAVVELAIIVVEVATRVRMLASALLFATRNTIVHCHTDKP